MGGPFPGCISAAIRASCSVVGCSMDDIRRRFKTLHRSGVVLDFVKAWRPDRHHQIDRIRTGNHKPCNDFELVLFKVSWLDGVTVRSDLASHYCARPDQVGEQKGRKQPLFRHSIPQPVKTETQVARDAVQITQTLQKNTFTKQCFGLVPSEQSVRFTITMFFQILFAWQQSTKSFFPARREPSCAISAQFCFGNFFVFFGLFPR